MWTLGQLISIKRPLKIYQKYTSGCVPKSILPEKFLQIIIKSSLAEFHNTSGKVLFFQRIRLNSFRQMRLKNENYSLRCVFF